MEREDFWQVYRSSVAFAVSILYGKFSISY